MKSISTWIISAYLFFCCAGCSDAVTGDASDTTTEEISDTATVETDDTETQSAAEQQTDADSSVDTATENDSTSEPVTQADCVAAGDGQSTLQFVNQCDSELTFKGSDIESGTLQPGQLACRHMGSDDEPISAIRFWGYIGPDPGGEHHTLAEMTLNTDFYDFDWYNISHVDAFNLPMAIVPLEMPDCPTKSCPDDLLPNCPDVGQFFMDGELVSCVSPDRNNKDSVVAQYFDKGCTEAYSWSGDDAESMAACAGEDYAIVFCP